MDKYLLIVLVFLIAGMGIAITKDPPVLGMFYAMLAGAIIVILYSAFKSRREHNLEKRKRRFKK